MRSLGDRKMEIARQSSEFIKVTDRGFGLAQQPPQFCKIGRGCVFRRELGAKRLDRALGVHDLCGSDTSEIELHSESLGEQAWITVRDAGAAAFAHADFDNAERLQRAQCVARDDAAGGEAGSEIFLRPEEIAWLEFLGEQ